jgi:hypothetical protein
VGTALKVFASRRGLLQSWQQSEHFITDNMALHTLQMDQKANETEVMM